MAALKKLRDWVAWKLMILATYIDTQEETYTAIKFSNRTIGTSWALTVNNRYGYGLSGGVRLAESDSYYDSVQAWPKVKEFTDLTEALDWANETATVLDGG